MKRGSAAELRPCPRNGVSWRAGVGRVRSLAFLSILRGVLLRFHTCGTSKFQCVKIVFLQPTKKGRFESTGSNKEMVGDCLGI